MKKLRRIISLGLTLDGSLMAHRGGVWNVEESKEMGKILRTAKV